MEKRLTRMEGIIERADSVSKYAQAASIIAIGPILKLFRIIG
jgi:hypothetical protein